MSGESVLNHLGPYIGHPPVKALCDLTARTWDQYHLLVGVHGIAGQNERQFVVNRMMHISEVMSRSVRMCATWALSHAAMSLLRDRYEQTVRFSWLARQPNDVEFRKYFLTLQSKTLAMMRNIHPDTRKNYEELMGPLPEWATADVTKEQKDKLKEWETLDLRSMAKKRDELPPLTTLLIGRETLANWYDVVYSQFSSVSHFDMYSIEMLQLFENQNGKLVLSADPYWPALLALFNALFDIVQSFESAQVFHKKDAAEPFDKLLQEWLTLWRQMKPEMREMVSGR